jgi:hypothetical protein
MVQRIGLSKCAQFQNWTFHRQRPTAEGSQSSKHRHIESQDCHGVLDAPGCAGMTTMGPSRVQSPTILARTSSVRRAISWNDSILQIATMPDVI